MSDHYPKDLDYDEVYDKKRDDKTWHIGQSYDGIKASSLFCAVCGSKEFNVGQGSWYTAIRCVNCKWEVSIHDG